MLEADAAERIRTSAIRDQLVAALDDWLVVYPAKDREYLLAVLRRADGDPWRDRLRDAVARKDRKALEELARDSNAAVQPPATLELFAFALQGLGDHSLAVEVLRPAQQRHPGDFWINHYLAMSLVGMSKAAEAVGYLRAALALRPESPGVHLNLGWALSHQGDLAGAECRKAIELDPKYASPHGNLGNALAQQGKLDEAIAEWKKIIELDPTNAVAHCNLGNALKAKGDLDGAERAYREAVRLDGNHRGAAIGTLAELLVSRGKLKEAIATYQKIAILEPDSADALNNLAWLLATCSEAKLRDPQQAVTLSKKAVELAPKNGGWWNTLGAAHYRAGDAKASIAALHKSMELRKGGDANDWFFLAMAHQQLGEKEKARSWYDKAVGWMGKNAPQSEALKRFRAEAQELLGIPTVDPAKNTPATKR